MGLLARSRARGLSVEVPNGEVQGRCERDPGEVGGPEPAGGVVDAEESDLEGEKEDEEDEDLNEGEVGATESKEENRPESVQCELDSV